MRKQLWKFREIKKEWKKYSYLQSKNNKKLFYMNLIACLILNKNSTIARLYISARNRTAERRGRQIAWIAYAWRTWKSYYLRVLSWSSLTSMFFGLLQKDLFKRKWSLTKSFFKQNFCHACHTRFAVFFPFPYSNWGLRRGDARVTESIYGLYALCGSLL